MTQPVSSFSGTELYLDTMVFHTLVRTQDEVTTRLFQRIESGELRAYTSVLTFDEFTYRMILSLIKDKYGGSPLDQLRQKQSHLLLEVLPRLEPVLEKLQNYPNLSIIDVTSSDLISIRQLMSEFQLLPRDATHLATMQKCRCFNLVSQDSDFDQIPFIQRFTLT